MTDIFAQFGDQITRVCPRLPGLFLYLLAGYLVIKILVSLLKNTLRIAKISPALVNIIISLSSIILWVILFSELAQEVGLSSLAVKISGSLLVVGLAVANGMSALAGDIVSGVYLSKDRDFDVGMRIKSGDYEGVIKKIDIRKTRLLADDGQLQIIPNSRIDTVGWSVLKQEEGESKTESGMKNQEVKMTA